MSASSVLESLIEAEDASLSWQQRLLNIGTARDPIIMFALMALPWILVGLYVLYYHFCKRPPRLPAQDLVPFHQFFQQLTDGASPGYDRKLFDLFHPALLKEGAIQRGVLRAMSRCVTTRFGKIVRISQEEVLRQSNAAQVSCMALVDFERAKRVKCQITYVRRLPITASSTSKEDNKDVDGNGGKDLSDTPKVNIVPHLLRFHVISFKVEPRPCDDYMNIFEFVNLDDFDGFVELFIQRLLNCRSGLRPAISMMIDEMKEKYDQPGSEEKLKESLDRVISACGGLTVDGDRAPADEVDAVQCSRKLRRLPPTDADSSAAKKISAPEEVVCGIEMGYEVKGKTRNLQMCVCLSFVGLRCVVSRYNVDLLPDRRAQVIVDQETGQSAVVA